MAKLITPEMEKINRKLAAQTARRTRRGKRKNTALATDAWKRFKRNRLAVAGVIIILLFIVLAVFADLIAPYGSDEQSFTEILKAPSWKHPFGTDNYGRDLLSRCIYGTRVSLPIGFICVIVGLIIGGGLGLIAGFSGGAVENVIMRIMDIFQSVPATLMSIAIVAALGNTMVNLIIAIVIAGMPGFAKTTRAAILTVKENEYITASRALGAGNVRQMLVHMVPNAIGPIVVMATFSMASSIMIVSGMSYLGLGITAPTAEWGSILNAGKVYIMQAPWFILYPGLCIGITILALNLFGDGLRDALDPRLK